MNTPRTAAAPLRGNFVVLRADTLRLLLPQSDVGAAEHLAQAPRATDMPGFFERTDSADALPVVALSAQMESMTRYPGDRFVVTPIATPLGEIGFGWNDLSVLIDVQLQPQPLPRALVAPHSPLREFVEIDGQVVFCCDAARVAQLALVNKA